ncbi:tail fiber assembly protein [Citrobacter freundii]|uniref:tail fiber assembly protein n=1 Tax=Citrobacter freundii TaxID=546 RepID=UPI0031B77B1D
MMMGNYIYSPATNGFYPLALKDDYVTAGSWPVDEVEVSDNTAHEFMVSAPQGKVRVAGADGLPAWADIPPPTAEELAQQAEAHRTQLLTYADAVMADWRTELALGEISDADKAKLTAWMAYKREVKAVDASKPVWPPKPAE